jgi:hypothetical protein
MNTVLLIAAAAMTTGVLALSVISYQRPEPHADSAEVLALARRMVEQQDLIQMDIAALASAQRAMLDDDRRRQAGIEHEVNRSKTFFERNMGIEPRGR